MATSWLHSCSLRDVSATTATISTYLTEVFRSLEWPLLLEVTAMALWCLTVDLSSSGSCALRSLWDGEPHGCTHGACTMTSSLLDQVAGGSGGFSNNMISGNQRILGKQRNYVLVSSHQAFLSHKGLSSNGEEKGMLDVHQLLQIRSVW